MNTPFRTPAAFAGQCGRGHMHTVEAMGAYCAVAPCRGVALGLPNDRIERVEVASGSVWPDAPHEFVLDYLIAALDVLSAPAGPA